MSGSRNDLPSVNSPNFNQRLRETIQTYLGRQGDPLERGLTLRDLLDSGLAKLPSGFKLATGAAKIPLQPGDSIGASYEADLTPPPSPTGFTASAGISHILIEHDAPLYLAGHGHLRTRVYGAIRAPGAAAPVFSDAIEVAQFSGTVYAHPTNPSTTWHLWIKWETADGVLSAGPAGGTNGVVVKSGEDVSALVAAMTGPGNPFKVVPSEVTLPDGTVVPPGTYTADAFIHNGQIVNAMMGNLSVDNAKIANVSVDKLTAGSIAVGQYIQSTSYIAGQQGWRINGDGNAEFANVVIRGSGRFWGELVNGTATAFDAGTGLYSGYDNGNYKFRIGTADGARLQWDSNSLLIRNANLDITSSGGSSISMSPSGSSILFKKADGTNSLSVDQQGNAVFSGSLYGATGTFEGTLAAGVLSSSAFDAIEYKYTTSGTYSLTIPPKKSGWTAMHMRVTVQGAGGGGGGGYANAGPNRNPVSSGGGGGAGQRQVFTVTSGVEPGQAVTVVVGQGGAGGQDAGDGWAGSNGGNGGASYVVVGGSQYTASGGVGGGVGTMGLADSALGGAGGSLGGVPGGGGNYGTRYNSVTETYAPNSNYGGAGGSSMYGSGGNGGPAWNGYAAQGGAGGMGAGGGGGGADAEHPDRRYTGWGGPGGGGFVLIELFDPNTVVLNNRYSNLILWLDSRGIGTVPTEAR